MVFLTLTLAMLALASCGRQDQGLYAERSLVRTDLAASPDGAPAYLGRWARTAADCAERPFIFEMKRIEAPSGSWCDVSDWQTSPAGYSLTTVCHVREGGPTPGRLLVTVPDHAQGKTLTVEGGPLDRPLGLIRCQSTEAAALTGAAG